MSSSSESTIHHRDVYGYYVALQDFFRDTEAKHDRSNSPRAQKARAKLLKLSPSQFYELSTDVFDELKRRSSNSPEQPEYLLPKASFHIKRNQARQKLANLSQTRFNDLVDDILFEIKRRGYDINPDASSEIHSNDQSAFDRSLTANSRNHQNESAVNSMSDNSVVQVPPTATIQTSQVIPKKASIDWSSEEEDENDFFKKPLMADASPQDYAHGVSSAELSAVENSPSDNYHYIDLNESPVAARQTRKNSIDQSNRELAKEIIADAPESRVDELKQELDGLKKANDTLRSEISGKDTELEKLRRQDTLPKANASSGRESSTFASNANIQKELSSLSSQVSALSIENENLKQEISELELKAKTMGSVKSSNGNFLESLQTRYPLDERSVSKYMGADGLVTLATIENFHEHINVMFVTIQSDKGDVGKDLFEALARASNCLHQMLLLVDTPQFKDEVILLRASLSHAVTAVRYYSVYRSVLPRVTVQAALSELAFAVCNLLNSTKIKMDDGKSKSENLKKSNEGKRTSAVGPKTPVEPQFGSSFSQDLLNKPNDVFTVSEDSKDEMSPVKPLKLTQRANMSPNPNLKPTSARKTSGSLFFTSMIDTKSPKSSLSSAHSSKIIFRSPNDLIDGAVEGKGKPLKLEVGKGKDQKPYDKRVQLKHESPPITPTKSVNNTTVEVIDGTPSLPTPAAVAPTSEKKNLMDTPSSKPSEETPAKKSSKNEAASEALKPQESSPSRSFADKLKEFANGTGIGLRVEKEPMAEPLATKKAAANGVTSSGTKENALKMETGKDTDLHKTTPGETNHHEVETSANTGRAFSSPDRNLKKINNSLLRPPEVNPTPSKLTDRFKKAFDDMSDNDSDDENKSDLNDSSNFSDDGSTYLALKQSMKRNGQSPQEHRTIQKATVYSPRAQQNSQFNDSETKFGTDTDLSDAPSEPSYVKEGVNVVGGPVLNAFPQGQETKPVTVARNESGNAGGSDELSLNAAPFDEDLDSKSVKKEDLDESSEYQFVPLRKEINQKGDTKPAKIMHEDKVRAEELEDEREVSFDFDAFDIENPDNTLSELLLYLEHQTVQVISTIQSLLTSIKQPEVTKGNLRSESNAINQVTRQMVDATSISMNQSRNASLKEHGTWVVKSLEDCSLRMITLCQLSREGKVNSIKGDEDFADKHFKQRLAGIAFDVAKCTKELVKTVEEASLKEEIAFLNSRLN